MSRPTIPQKIEDMSKLRPDVRAIAREVSAVLSDDLRLSKYRGDANRFKGHCYVASEALYHLAGGASAYLRPMNIKHEDDQHWFLASPGGPIDVTAAQFKTPVPYGEARGRGFLTKQPSKRAAEVIRRVRARRRAAT